MDYEIKSATKEKIISTGERFIEVTTLFGEDIVRKFAFSLQTPAEEIEKEMKAIAKTLDKEKEQAIEEVERNKVEDKADKTIETLLDKTKKEKNGNK